jgi:hypothetical protein
MSYLLYGLEERSSTEGIWGRSAEEGSRKCQSEVFPNFSSRSSSNETTNFVYIFHSNYLKSLPLERITIFY